MRTVKLRVLIFVFILGLTQVSWTQTDTSRISWSKALYEVCTTKQDSFSSQKYIEKKIPFFAYYFSRFSQNELDSLRRKCIEVMETTRGDSLQYPQYVDKVEYYWNVSTMMLFLDLEKAENDRKKYYDSFGDSIRLELIVNGQQVSLHDNFKIFYILDVENQKRIVEAKVCKDIFVAPDIGKDSVGTVIFEYGNKYYFIIKRHDLQELKEEVKLTLIFETKPYKPILLNDSNLTFTVKNTRDNLDKQKDMNGVFYVQFSRFDIFSCIYFRKKSDFFRKGKIVMRNTRT